MENKNIEYIKNVHGLSVIPVYSSRLFSWTTPKNRHQAHGTCEFSTLTAALSSLTEYSNVVYVKSSKTGVTLSFYLVGKIHSSEGEFLYADYETSFSDGSIRIRIFNT